MSIEVTVVSSGVSMGYVWPSVNHLQPGWSFDILQQAYAFAVVYGWAEVHFNSGERMKISLDYCTQDIPCEAPKLVAYPCAPAPQSPKALKAAACTPQKEGKKTMGMFNRYSNDVAEKTKAFLLDRLSEARDSHTDKAMKHFRIADDDRPRTPEEFVQRIKDGKYELKGPDAVDTDGTQHYWDNPWRYLKWRTEKPDTDGWKAFKAQSDADYKAVEDIIVVKDADTALTAVQEYAKKTYH